MKSAEFIRQTTKENLPPCVLLVGEDGYFIEAALSRVKKLTGGSGDFDYSKFDEENFGDFLQSLDTFPLMSEKRVSVISIEKADAKDKAFEKKKKLLEKYASSPSALSVAVVIIKSGVKSLDGFTAVDCGKESLQNVSKWIVLYLKKQGVSISEELAKVIATRCNLDMARVKTSADIISEYKDCKGSVSTEDVDKLVADETEAQVFDLVNAIVDKNVAKAMALVEKIKAQKISGTAFSGMLYGNYRRMFFACVSPLSSEEVARELNVKEYAIIKAREIAKRYSARRIKTAMEYLENVDFNVKSGKTKDADVIETCVLHLVNL